MYVWAIWSNQKINLNKFHGNNSCFPPDAWSHLSNYFFKTYVHIHKNRNKHCSPGTVNNDIENNNVNAITCVTFLVYLDITVNKICMTAWKT